MFIINNKSIHDYDKLIQDKIEKYLENMINNEKITKDKTPIKSTFLIFWN